MSEKVGKWNFNSHRIEAPARLLPKVREDPIRQFLGEVIRWFTRLNLGLRVSDITCGLKGFEREAAFDIFSRSRIERWGYDAEIIFLAQKFGYRISEIPVDWYHSFDSKVRVGSACVKTLTEILQLTNG